MKDTETLLRNAGWWGTKAVTDPATGKFVLTKFDSARLKLIYDTNTRQAYAAGLWERVERNKASHPFVRYITKQDERVRASHRSWDNVTLPVDDAFWKTHWPPNGWRCRCRVVSMNQREYDQGVTPTGAPLKTERTPIALREHVNARTGEITEVPQGIDPGFGYNAGMARQRAQDGMVRDKLASAAPELAQSARGAGLAPPAIAREKPDQPDWKTLGFDSLKNVTPRAATPALVQRASTAAQAKDVLRKALGMDDGANIQIDTPVGPVNILDKTLDHVVKKQDDARERYANFVLPTLQSPDEVWSTAYDDATIRQRFIKLFSGSKYDLLVIVKTDPNGDIFWNMMQRDRKTMDTLRVGTRLYSAAGNE